MIDLEEIILHWREALGDMQLISPPLPDGPDILFRWVGWYYRSKQILLGHPIWIGPFELKEQAEQARDEEAVGL